MRLKTIFGLLAFSFVLAACATFGGGGSGVYTTPAGDDSPAGTIDYDTELVLNISRISEDGTSKDWLTVSPDGKKILYSETEAKLNRDDISYDGIDSYKTMLLKDAARPQKTPIITEFSTMPAWFDDSTAFVYISLERDGNKLVRSTTTGAGKVYVTRNPIGRYDAGPAVKGHTILYDSEINGRRQIISVLDNGMDVTVLTEGYAASWHPLGKKFVFVKGGDIYEMDMSNNLVTQIFLDRGMKCANPHYSPDGRYILFQKETNVYNDDYDTVRWHLYVTKADGSGLSQLTLGNVDVFSPSWASNSAIYFLANAGGSREIWTATLHLVR
jgi:Tol biopolymer transport system component/predicted small secreted protein